MNIFPWVRMQDLASTDVFAFLKQSDGQKLKVKTWTFSEQVHLLLNVS